MKYRISLYPKKPKTFVDKTISNVAARIYMQEQQAPLKAFILAYKLKHSCVDCGFNDPRALDFDHVQRKTKKYTVSAMVVARMSLELIKDEIKKCQIRCANCHRIKTSKEIRKIKVRREKFAQTKQNQLNGLRVLFDQPQKTQINTN